MPAEKMTTYAGPYLDEGLLARELERFLTARPARVSVQRSGHHLSVSARTPGSWRPLLGLNASVTVTLVRVPHGLTVIVRPGSAVARVVAITLGMLLGLVFLLPFALVVTALVGFAHQRDLVGYADRILDRQLAGCASWDVSAGAAAWSHVPVRHPVGEPQAGEGPQAEPDGHAEAAVARPAGSAPASRSERATAPDSGLDVAEEAVDAGPVSDEEEDWEAGWQGSTSSASGRLCQACDKELTEGLTACTRCGTMA